MRSRKIANGRDKLFLSFITACCLRHLSDCDQRDCEKGDIKICKPEVHIPPVPWYLGEAWSCSLRSHAYDRIITVVVRCLFTNVCQFDVVYFNSERPPFNLGRHRQLSPLAGVHVSPICLGGGNIGYKWGKLGMGEMNRESSFKLLDAFYEAGGNFIDTANNYDDGASEEIIGEWMEERDIRDQIVIATKYTSIHKRDQPIKQRTHYAGNNMKALHISIESSMKSLRTSYIDILYVHWWDFNTTVEEVMNGLHHLVAAGKVLYLGISDTPASIVAEANTYARLMGKTPFVIYQGAWSVLQRDFERDIIPMARRLGLALAPWNVLAGGKIRTDAEEERRRLSGEKGRTLLSANWERSFEQRNLCLALEQVAEQVGAKSISAVAIAYVMHKTTHVFPVVGGRKVEQLMDNIEALEISLTEDHMKYLEGVMPFDVGFPHNLCGDGTENSRSFKAAGHFDKWPLPTPITPARH